MIHHTVGRNSPLRIKKRKRFKENVTHQPANCSHHDTTVGDIAGAGVSVSCVTYAAKCVCCTAVAAVTLGQAAASIAELASAWVACGLEAKATRLICQAAVTLVGARRSEPWQSNLHLLDILGSNSHADDRLSGIRVDAASVASR